MQELHNHRRGQFLGPVLMAAVLAAGNATAADLFTVTVETEGATQTAGFNDAQDAIEIYEDGTFEEVNARYTDTSIALATLNFRGVVATVNYPTDGTRLVFSVPSLGISETFTGIDRDDSEQQLIDFLEKNQNDLLSQILQALVANSPVDPVAGNPNSLMGKMVDADFGLGSTVGPQNAFNSNRAGGETAPNLIQLPARFGRFSAGDFDTNVVDLPLGYVLTLADPRYAINFDLPLTYVETEGAQSFAASFGVGARVPIFDNWSITPAVRFGGTGSVELGAVAGLYSGSVTSNYEREIFGLNFALGNSLSVIRSVPLSFGDVDIDYNLTNFVFRNGVGLSGGIGSELFGEPLTWEAAVVNTQYFGDELFVENQTDLSVSVGTEGSDSGLTWDSLRVGLTYTFTDADYSGFRLNFGYQF